MVDPDSVFIMGVFGAVSNRLREINGSDCIGMCSRCNMEPTTIRLSTELLEELDAEAEAAGISSRSEYIRYLLANRDRVADQLLSDAGPTTLDAEVPGEKEGMSDSVLDRLATLEDRVADLEAKIDHFGESGSVGSQAEGLKAENEGPTSTELGGGEETAEKSDDEPEDSESEQDSETVAQEIGEQSQEVFGELERWLAEEGPQSDTAQAIMLDAAKILDERGPLKSKELREELVSQYPDAYSSANGLWSSTVQRLYDETPGFGKPEYGTYEFDRQNFR